MIDTPEITRTEARTAAVVRLTIPRSEMQERFREAVDELMATLADQGVEPAGPVFAHHLELDPETFDFELGMPVEAPVEADGRVEPGELPGTTVARTVHRGPYDGLPDAWGEFEAWMEENGHDPAPDMWECYVTGPHSSPDPSDWETELNWPLADGQGDR